MKWLLFCLSIYFIIQMNDVENEKILSEIQNEMEEKVKRAEFNENLFNKKIHVLQRKLLQTAKLKCKDVYKFFEKNGEPTINENGVQFKLGENEKENLAHYRELEVCVAKYDYGVQKEMHDQHKKAQEISDSHYTCLESCDQKITQIEKKSCFRDCINISFSKSDEIQKKIEKKVDDAIIKIDKLLI